jgi:DNA-binding NtrC family response regulator
MTSISGPVLIVIDDPNLCQYVNCALEGAGFTTIVTSSVQTARPILHTTSVACLVIMDYLAITYPSGAENLFQELPATFPTLTLIRPSPASLVAFDQIRRPPYNLHEYLTIPVAADEIISVVRYITTSVA